MSSFADFAREVIARQIAYYEGAGGEYNQDPFSLQYETRMTVDRVFALPQGANRPESWTSFHTSSKLETLANQFKESIASEENRQQALFQKHREALAQREHELAEIRSAEISNDPLFSVLSNEPIVKTALLEYRRYGLGELRYVNQACILAIVDPTSRKWFFPRQLPTHSVRLDPSLFCPGDAKGSIDQDRDGNRNCHVPNDLRVPRDGEPVWFSQLNAFHPLDLLQSTPWVGPEQEDAMPSSFDPGQELVRAMVVTCQVATFLGEKEGLGAASYAYVDKLHAVFHRYVKTQFVDPALEAIRQRFQASDWSNFCTMALKHLPVFRSCGENDRQHNDDGMECILTGQSRDLVRVVVVRCPILEWDGSTLFEDHIRQFTTRYALGQKRWWNLFNHPWLCTRDDRRPGTKRTRLSSCSSTSSLMLGTNSRHRGRRTIEPVSSVENATDAQDGDFDGFVVGPWTKSCFLHRTMADLLRQAWRLTHLEWWMKATLVQWKRDKSLFPVTNEEAICYVTNTIVTALAQCRA